jgi:DNA modification methylase
VLSEVAEQLPADTSHSLNSKILTVNCDNFLWLPSQSVDLVLTDPPFNIARDTNFHTWDKNTINSYRFDDDKGWDTYTPDAFVALMESWAVGFARVLRPGGTFAVFCADTYLSHFTDALVAAGLKPRRTLTWRKPNAVPINRKTMMMSSCEYVIVGVKGAKATFNSDVPLDGTAASTEIERVLVGDKVAAVVEKEVRAAVEAVLSTGSTRASDMAAAVTAAVQRASVQAGERAEAMYVTDGPEPFLRACVPNHVSFNSKTGKRSHPTEKPVALLRYLVALLSAPGDVILDPFGGSGSTGVAGAQLGRQVVVVERDDEFYLKLVSRLSENDLV